MAHGWYNEIRKGYKPWALQTANTKQTANSFRQARKYARSFASHFTLKCIK